MVDRAGAPSEDELLPALCGRSVLEWARRALVDTGSDRWQSLGLRLNAKPGELDALLTLWQELRGGTEAAIWRTATNVEDLRELRAWLAASEHCESASDLQEARNEHWGGKVRCGLASAEWMEGCGVPLAGAVDEGSYFTHEAQSRVGRRLTEQRAAGLPAGLLQAARREPLVRVERFLQAERAHLRDEAYEKASACLQQEWAQRLAERVHGEEVVLLEAAFERGHASAEEALESARQGDLACVLAGCPAGVEVLGGRIAVLARRCWGVSIELPFSDCRSEGSEIAALQGVHLVCEAGMLRGRKAMGGRELEAALEDATRLLAGALTTRDGQPANTHSELRHSVTWKPPAGQPWPPAWRDLIDSYGFKQVASREGVQVELEVSLPRPSIEAWALAPHSKDPQFCDTFVRLSRTVQRTMRRWVHASAVQSMADYGNFAETAHLILFSASKPYAAKKRGMFGYDLMNPEAKRRALLSARPRLDEWRERIESGLRLSGMEKQADSYGMKAARKRWMPPTMVQRRLFEGLMAIENHLLEQFFLLADTARGLRGQLVSDPRRAVRRVSQEGRALAESLVAGLRRGYRRKDLGALVPLLLVEATAALEGEGLEAVEADVRLMVREGEWVECWRRPRSAGLTDGEEAEEAA
jgi:hypothetical protein